MSALVDAVVLDDDEAVLCVGRGDVAARIAALSAVARVECGDGVGHARAIVPTVSGM